jgi:hypothetical protein
MMKKRDKMRSEKEVRKRAELWKQFANKHKGPGNEETKRILTKLGFDTDTELIDDPWYDGQAAWRIYQELLWVLGRENMSADFWIEFLQAVVRFHDRTPPHDD